MDNHAERPFFLRGRVGYRRTVLAPIVAPRIKLPATIEMEDLIFADSLRDCRNLLWRGAFSSSNVCARRSLGIADAVVGSIPQCVGIRGGSNPARRWNVPGAEHKISNGRNFDWRISDRSHAISVSSHFNTCLPRRIGRGDQCWDKLCRGHIAFLRISTSVGIGVVTGVVRATLRWAALCVALASSRQVLPCSYR